MTGSECASCYVCYVALSDMHKPKMNDKSEVGMCYAYASGLHEYFFCNDYCNCWIEFWIPDCILAITFETVSRPEVFCKRYIRKNFAKFTGKHLWQSFFFNKIVLDLQKKRLWYRCFPVNFTKFLRTTFLQNTSGDCFCILLVDTYAILNLD